MTALNKIGFKSLVAGALLACAFGQAAQAAEVGGIKFDDTVKVAGKELQLNGLGIRVKFGVFKVYATGLYLTEKHSVVADVLKAEGPRRVELVMMRDVGSEEFGDAFMKGLKENTSTAEQTKVLNQTMQFGEMFALLPGLKKGDVLHLDWLPGVGTQCALNGKKIGEVVPDLMFFNAVLRIWLGDKPADRALKPKLLGEAKPAK